MIFFAAGVKLVCVMMMPVVNLPTRSCANCRNPLMPGEASGENRTNASPRSGVGFGLLLVGRGVCFTIISADGRNEVTILARLRSFISNDIPIYQRVVPWSAVIAVFGLELVERQVNLVLANLIALLSGSAHALRFQAGKLCLLCLASFRSWFSMLAKVAQPPFRSQKYRPSYCQPCCRSPRRRVKVAIALRQQYYSNVKVKALRCFVRTSMSNNLMRADLEKDPLNFGPIESLLTSDHNHTNIKHKLVSINSNVDIKRAKF